MLDRPLQTLTNSMLGRAGCAIGNRVGLNVMILLAFVAGIVAIGAISAHAYYVGLGLLALNRLLSALANACARVKGKTPLNAMLDTTLDVIVNAGIVLAFAQADPSRALAAAFLLFALAVLWAATLESTSGGETWSLIGHTETFIGFAVACVWPEWFSLICYVMGTIAFIGTGLRIADAATRHPPA